MSELANVVPLEGVGKRRVDYTRGSHSGVVSSQWFQRPDDQRFLNLEDLYAAVKRRAEDSWVMTQETRQLRVLAKVDDPTTLLLEADGGQIISPTNWSFGQICQQIRCPAPFLSELPAAIAAVPLQHRLMTFRGEVVKLFGAGAQDDVKELRASTSPSYGRIYDHEVVCSVMKFAGSGSGWKVPGVMDWGTGEYDPNVEPSLHTTTLYASDRDVFVFLCKDTHPIEVGRLDNGDPDYLFPGFVVSNSEVGSRALKIDTMFLRAVCCNRNLWGVEGYRSMSIRHSKFAPERFAEEAEPVLLSFANEASRPVRQKVIAAKNAVVATEDEERESWLRERKFSEKAAKEVIEKFTTIEGRGPTSIWDFVQAVSAHARDIPHQDERMALEVTAGRWMEKVAA